MANLLRIILPFLFFSTATYLRKLTLEIEIEVRHPSGFLLTGQTQDGNQQNTPVNSPNIGAGGNFVIGSDGRITINHLSPGVYHVRVLNTPNHADEQTHVVTVQAGQQAVLEINIEPLAGLRLIHRNSITGEPIFNAEFMVFDSNNHVVGVFYTDNEGVIDFAAILEPGRYTIRMTRPAPGFHRDDVPRTVEFRAGQVTEVVWESVPEAGQLQIQVISADVNQINSFPAGTPLEGAVFEIFDFRTGNLVDRIASDHNGMAASRPLPLGRFFTRQVQAPPFYGRNAQEMHFDIEHPNQIVRVVFPNQSANTGVRIAKVGPHEIMQGQELFFDIRTIRNESTIPLSDFYWRDVIPTEAIRVSRLVTGTFNHELRYRIIGTTNTGNEIIIADQLSSTRNNVVNMHPAHLGLPANEYLIDFTVVFGQVPAGFMEVEAPRVFFNSLHTSHALLPNGMMFVNRVDVGGRNGDEWVISNDTWATTIFAPNRRIPQSGF